MSKADGQAVVGVIFSRADLRRAVRLPIPPDLFEIRLDALVGQVGELVETLDQLKPPLIVTARHPAEGGMNSLQLRDRRSLLLRFLPHASYVDIEVRSIKGLAEVLQEARKQKVGRILSFHDFDGTPTGTRLDEIARTAELQSANILKVATRVDSPPQLDRLRTFFLRHNSKRKPLAVMGLGRLGHQSRAEFATAGSALNYAHLGTPRAEGQLSIQDLRHILARKFLS
jgi:3-dehydroquinate dehydratase-1